jgi:hypothetical protein
MRRVSGGNRDALRRVSGMGAMIACLVMVNVGVPVVSAAHAASLRALLPPTGCSTPKAELIQTIDSMITRVNSSERTSFNLPVGPVSSVSVIRDSKICKRAARAAGLSRLTPDSLADPVVAVLRVGPTRYVVTDNAVYAGEYQIHLVFDSAFTVPPLAIFNH